MRLRSGWGTYTPSGDVNKAIEVIYKIASLPELPLHFPLGEAAIAHARKQLAAFSAEIDKYESWSQNLTKD